MCGRRIIRIIIIVKKKCRIAIGHPTAFGVTLLIIRRIIRIIIIIVKKKFYVE